MNTLFNLLARILARPAIANYLIHRAQRTPYFHLDGYMDRFWLVPYASADAGEGCGPVAFLERPIAWVLQRFGIALRIHHILREDWAADPHDHPWHARSFILKGWYIERRHGCIWLKVRRAGQTSTLRFGEFHKITDVPVGGVWTLFVTRKYQGTWGFLVDGVKVPWREYTGRN